MAKQTYWEDVEAGSEVPALEKNPTTQQLVKYAGASGDFYQIHYDKDFAAGSDHLVDCEIWLENTKGEKTTIGSATVILPSREGAR